MHYDIKFVKHSFIETLTSFGHVKWTQSTVVKFCYKIIYLKKNIKPVDVYLIDQKRRKVT